MCGVSNSREVKDHSGRITKNRLYNQGDMPVPSTKKIDAQWQSRKSYNPEEAGSILRVGFTENEKDFIPQKKQYKYCRNENGHD